VQQTNDGAELVKSAVVPQLLMERINMLTGKRAAVEQDRLNEALNGMAKSLGVDPSASAASPAQSVTTMG
jgi:hypothetical protein